MKVKAPENAVKATAVLDSSVNVIPMEEKEDSACHVFCYAALADKHTGTMYTDATGALPVVTLEGHQYYFVAYAYDPNYIFAIPMRNVKDESILKAFDNVFQELKEKGFKPEFNVMDNQATRPIKEYLKKENAKWQFVEPHNHRINAAERAIQTFKNHFISGLCSTDRDWPLQLWDQLTPKALITLNLLRTSRIDPTKSAYHQMFGHKYDWNAHPLAPPGTKAVIYESPDTRTSWGNRGLDAWYCGPALDHYRNSIFFVPATKAYRTSGSFDLFPQHCILPTFTPEQHSTEVCSELFESVQKLSKPAKQKLLRKISKALEIVSNDTQVQRVDEQTLEGEQISEGEITFQRVDSPPVTTTNDPTNPRSLQTKPRVHSRLARNNTPGQLPTIINPPRTFALATSFKTIGRSCGSTDYYGYTTKLHTNTFAFAKHYCFQCCTAID
jgi:polyhydroxyalkanoate synthesis regulator phasin